MPDSENKVDNKKGDEVLRRMLKTPPEPKTLPSRSLGRKEAVMKRRIADIILRVLGLSAWDEDGVSFGADVDIRSAE